MEGTAPPVCVVVDDGDVRNALACLIRSFGRQVETFASARAFMTRSRPDGPTCLVPDVRLTGENGLRVQQARQHAAWYPPIIFLTGYATIPLCVQAMKAGAVDFLLKPVDAEALQATVATALAQDAHRRDSQHHHAALHQRFATLTSRERTVLGLVITGLRHKEIASTLGTSERTIKAHRVNIMRRMQAISIAELIRMVAMMERSKRQTAPLQAISEGG
jgi:FixJ family two-component response regulator